MTRRHRTLKGNPVNTTIRTTSRFGVLLAAGALLLAGCASTSTPAADTEAATQADSFAISDAWVKSAESGM